MPKYDELLRDMNNRDASLESESAQRARQLDNASDQIEYALEDEKINKTAAEGKKWEAAGQIIEGLAKSGANIYEQYKEYEAGQKVSALSMQMANDIENLKGKSPAEIKKFLDGGKFRSMQKQLEAELENTPLEAKIKAMDSFKAAAGKYSLQARGILGTAMQAEVKAYSEKLVNDANLAGYELRNPNFRDIINDRFPMMSDADKETLLSKADENHSLGKVARYEESGNVRGLKQMRDKFKRQGKGKRAVEISGKIKSAKDKGLAEQKKLILNPTSPESLQRLRKVTENLDNQGAIDRYNTYITGVQSFSLMGHSNDPTGDFGYKNRLVNMGYSSDEADKIVDNAKELVRKYPHKAAEAAGINITAVPSDTRAAVGIAPIDRGTTLLLKQELLANFSDGDTYKVQAAIEHQADKFNTKSEYVRTYIASALDDIDESDPNYASAQALKMYLEHPEIFSKDVLTRVTGSKGLIDKIPSNVDTIDTTSFDNAYTKYKGQTKDDIKRMAQIVTAYRLDNTEGVPTSKEAYAEKFEQVYKQVLAKVNATQDPDSDDGPFFVSRQRYLGMTPAEKRRVDSFNSTLKPNILASNAIFSADTRKHFQNAKDIHYIKDSNGKYGIHIVTQNDTIHKAYLEGGKVPFEFNADMVKGGNMPTSMYTTPNSSGNGLLNTLNNLPEIEMGDVAGFESSSVKLYSKDAAKDYMSSMYDAGYDSTGAVMGLKAAAIRVDNTLKEENILEGVTDPNVNYNTVLEQRITDKYFTKDQLKEIEKYLPKKEDKGFISGIIDAAFSTKSDLNRERVINRLAQKFAVRTKVFGPRIIKDMVANHPDQKEVIKEAISTGRMGDLHAFYDHYLNLKKKPEDGGLVLLQQYMNRVPIAEGGVQDTSAVYSGELEHDSYGSILGYDFEGDPSYKAGDILTRSQGISNQLSNKGIDFYAPNAELGLRTGETIYWLDLEEIFNEVQ